MSTCNVCLVNKRTQRAHPKNTFHTADLPFGLVYTALISPITPAAKGGHRYISKFTDELTRYKAVYPSWTKDKAFDTLVRFTTELVIPSGFRFQCLRFDGGGTYRAGYF